MVGLPFRRGRIAFQIVLGFLIGCSANKASAPVPPGIFADTIFLNGDIVTVNDQQPAAEAIAVKDGKILLVGDGPDVLKFKGPATQVIDLDGKTLVPGFLDGHSHFINSITVANQANCYAAPFGPGNTRQGIIDALKKLQSDKKTRKANRFSVTVTTTAFSPKVASSPRPIWIPISPTIRFMSSTCRFTAQCSTASR